MQPHVAPELRIPTRGDRFGIGVFIVAGVVIVVWAVVAATVRILAALASEEVRVPAEFAGTPAQAPIGPEGAAVALELDRAILTTADLPAASLGALIASEVVAAAAVTTVVTCLVLLSMSILRGLVFSRRNTRLVATASIVGLLGAALVPFLANMAANGAFARLSASTFDNVIMTVDFMPFMLGGFVVAIIGTAFSVGERLQRDTEGLV